MKNFKVVVLVARRSKLANPVDFDALVGTAASLPEEGLSFYRSYVVTAADFTEATRLVEELGGGTQSEPERGLILEMSTEWMPEVDHLFEDHDVTADSLSRRGVHLASGKILFDPSDDDEEAAN